MVRPKGKHDTLHKNKNILINNNLLESQLDFEYSSNIKYDPPRYNINLFRHNTFEYDSSLYDNYCTDLYGKRTCILFQMKEQFEVRMMDKMEKKTVTTCKDVLYMLIPNLIRYKYTVVIVEEINGHRHEITAIHLPIK